MPINPTSPINAPEGTNVLQSFSDATAGRSLQLFYAMLSKDSIGVSYVLGRDAGISEPTSVHATEFDLDFDITINKPTIFAGIGTIDVNWVASSSGGGEEGDYQITFNIYHYDGVTETLIGTVSTQSINTRSSVQVQASKLIVNITRKLFGVGHVLRLNAVGSATIREVKIFANPTIGGEELKFWMPVVNLE